MSKRQAKSDGAEPEPGPDIRARCGIDRTTPLAVYSGLGHAKRGIGVMIDAMPKLPDLHVALVINQAAYASELKQALYRR